MADVICPFMSCRVTSIDQVSQQTGNPPKITPTVVKCQKTECAIWDGANKCCSVKSVAMELIRGNERGGA